MGVTRLNIACGTKMTTLEANIPIPEKHRSDLGERGQAIYEKLKPKLEPEFNGQHVVIHVDTEEYTVATAFTAANHAMMARRPIDGRLFGRKIGPEPDNDRVAQITAMEVLAEGRK